MKSLTYLCTALLTDVGRLCSVNTDRDLITIKTRSQHEGQSFFTITLPEFASEFERALEAGQVDSTFFAGWRKRGCLPAFLRDFTSLVFGTNGRILHEPCSEAVYGVRQICRVFKKVRLPCSDARERRAFRNYLQIEAALSQNASPIDDARLHHFCGVADRIWGSALGSEFNTFGVDPRHGPGATAERVSGNAKYSLLRWHERLERSFPVTQHYFTSVNHMLHQTQGLTGLDMVPESQELPVRVISVPKTLKGPRIIAIEPVCMQYTQQAVGRFLTKAIKHSFLGSTIYFDDQRPNQRMAIRASLDRSFSTIDLSDASDRVPLSMVRLMLRSQPELLTAVEDCRSRTAMLPDGEVVSLSKFASMGSALCFPIEAMYFLTLIVHSQFWEQRHLPSCHELIKFVRQVLVFGDDIIVPRHMTDTVVEALHTFRCKVNTTKSFANGYFRESCGTDAFHGVDVTPVYVREMRPSSRRSSQALASWIATSNQFHKSGCWSTAHYMKSVVERQLGKLPVVHDTSPGLGWFSFQGVQSGLRQCKHLHRPIVRTYTIRATNQKDPLNGYPALLKYFLNSTDVSSWMPKSLGKKHLAVSARCGTVSRKRHWVPVT